MNVPSVENSILQIISLLKRSHIEAPGYDEDSDGEIWEWVEWDDLDLIRLQLREARNELIGLLDRIEDKERQCRD